MRRKLVLGVGLAALVGGTATGQFAADRVPPTTGIPMGAPKAAPPATLPGGLQPVTGASTPAPVLGGFQPLTPPVSPSSPVRPASPSSPAPLYSSPPSTTGYVPPVDGLRPTYGSPTPAPAASYAPLPVNVEIPSVLGKEHPWLLKPEHGPYFIMVKSYVRPSKPEDGGWTARQLGEGLASEIRETYRVQAFLFEYISEERKAEERSVAQARQKAQTEYLAQLDAIKHKSQLQGMDFLAPDNKLRVKRHDQRDQIGVLVGGFQSEADALKALAKLKTWPTPKNEILLDKGLILTSPDSGKATSEAAAINPYASAFVVPNPSIAKTVNPQRQGLDPFIVKLNEGHAYNLLKAQKSWTLSVKSFTAPVEIVSKNSDTSLMRKFGMGKGGDVLAAGGEQAEAMAKALRAMKDKGGQSLNLEAFVLHTRHASIVTVGQFDGPEDPALLATKRFLTGMKLHVTEDQNGLRQATNAPSLFDNILPMPIPKP